VGSRTSAAEEKVSERGIKGSLKEKGVGQEFQIGKGGRHGGRGGRKDNSGKGEYYSGGEPPTDALGAQPKIHAQGNKGRAESRGGKGEIKQKGPQTCENTLIS